MKPSVHSLPPEILASIFSKAICRCKREVNHYSPLPILSPLSLAAVCRQWRDVALDYRPLWTHIDLLVDVMDPDGRYHSPEIWVERSKGAPLYVHVVQLRYPTEDFFDEEDEEEGGPERPPSPMVRRLLEFLSLLMPQVCSLTPSLSWPYDSILIGLLDRWITHGTRGNAKELICQTNSELSDMWVPSSTRYQRFFSSLKVLHLHNTVLSWPRFGFKHLIELEIQLGVGEWSMTQAELTGMLASCPRLHRLALGRLGIKCPEQHPTPALLNKLQRLDITRCDSHSVAEGATMVESILSIIDPGRNKLSLSVSLRYHNSPQQTLDAITSFIGRSNATTLLIEGSDTRYVSRHPCFASAFGPLPNVQTLILDNWYFCDTTQIVRDRQFLSIIETHNNPRPINPELVLWPQLRNLYLHRCFLERGHIHQIISLHSIRELYWRDCYDGSGLRDHFEIGSQTSQEYARLLSQVVPKVVHFSNGQCTWPPVFS